MKHYEDSGMDNESPRRMVQISSIFDITIASYGQIMVWLYDNSNISDNINMNYLKINSPYNQKINNKKNKINEILKLYIIKGDKKYDMNITHIQHALKITQLAKNNNETMIYGMMSWTFC